MKTIILFGVLLLPVIGFPQQDWLKNSASGNMWQNVGSPGFSSAGSYYTSLAFSPADGQPYVAYVDMPVGCGTSGPGTVMRFDGVQWVNVEMAGFTTDAIGYTSLAFSPVDHLPYVAFAAGCSSGLQAKLMKFTGTTWEYVGGGGFSPGTAAYTSLAFNPVSGQPYVAFMDLINSNKVSVMKFDGTAWEYVGSPDFSAGEGWFVKIAFSPDGIPYVVYQDFINTRDVSVMKFDGTGWVYVGPAVFTSGELDEIGFGISPVDGQPYVAIDDPGNFHRIQVLKFDGIDWVPVGNIDSTQGFASRMCVAFGPSGQIYVSWWDASCPGLCVKTFDGNNWLTIGSTGFSAGYVDYPSFHLSAAGMPYLAYMDEGCLGKATVMKYDFTAGIDQVNDPGMFLYPNPVEDYLTLEYRNNFAVKNIDVYNSAGKRVVVSRTSKDRVILNTQDLTAGIYTLKLSTEKAVYTAKFCKK